VSRYRYFGFFPNVSHSQSGTQSKHLQIKLSPSSRAQRGGKVVADERIGGFNTWMQKCNWKVLRTQRHQHGHIQMPFKTPVQ
jgi:hypothetical protein